MAVLKKSDIKPPVLPKKTVTVDSLGGDVVVRGLMLSERMRIFRSDDEGNSDISLLLSMTVTDAEGNLLFTQAEWEDFGADPDRFIDTLKLFREAKAISGLDAKAAEKNS